MKNIRTLLFLITTFSMSLTAFSQVSQKDKNAYEELLNQNVKMFYNSHGKVENQQVLKKFERLKNMADDQWLPLYYTALTRIYLVNDLSGEDRQNNYLDLAAEELKKAAVLGDNSEVQVALARVYIKKVMLDPTKGPAYTGKIREHLKNAVQMDSDNPRVFLMYGIYYLNFPSFAGGDHEKGEKSILKAARLFEAESENLNENNFISPHWGKGWNAKYVKAIQG